MPEAISRMKDSELIKRLDTAFKLRAAGSYMKALSILESLETLSTDSRDISALRLFQSYCLLDLGRISDAWNRIAFVNESDLIPMLQGNYRYHFARICRDLGQTQ